MKYVEIIGERLAVRSSPTFHQRSRCPRLLKKHYIDKEEERTVRVAAERGKAAHRATEELLRHVIDEKIEVADIVDALVVEAVERNTPHMILGELGEILRWMKLWRDRFELRHPELVYGTEERLALDDAYDECDWSDASYRGVIDLLEIERDHAIVTDWKSQPHIMPGGELQTHEATTFYSWLIWKQYPHVTRFTTRIWYYRYGFYDIARRTIGDLEEFEDVLIMREHKISEIDNWDPIPGKHCGYCDYMHDCPLAMELGPENTNIISQEQAVLAAQRVTVMDALSKELKVGLKQYVDHNDEVLTANDWVFGYDLKEGDNWKPAEVKEVLERYGHDLAELVNIDSKSMKKFIRKATKEEELGLIADLAAITHTKHSTRFQGYQKPPK